MREIDNIKANLKFSIILMAVTSITFLIVVATTLNKQPTAPDKPVDLYKKVCRIVDKDLLSTSSEKLKRVDRNRVTILCGDKK